MDRAALTRRLRGTDLAFLYAGAVLVVAIAMRFMPAAERNGIIQDCSTNVANLREFPLRVLALSALVVQTLPELLLLIPLVIVVTASTRWLGRSATVVALGFGHVFATLSVAVLIVAGLHRGLLDPGIARAPDVGTSYALAGVAGLLSARVRGWFRAAYLGGAAVLLLVLLLTSADFTQAGHAVAFAIGLGLALVASRASRHAGSIEPPLLEGGEG